MNTKEFLEVGVDKASKLTDEIEEMANNTAPTQQDLIRVLCLSSTLKGWLQGGLDVVESLSKAEKRVR